MVLWPFQFNGTRHRQERVEAPRVHPEPPGMRPRAGDLGGLAPVFEVRR
jgi:hypothetical protein